MVTLWTYLILLQMCYIKGEDYYLSDQAALAEDAPHLCHLASPPLMFTATGQSIGPLNVTTNEPFWVGYSQVYTAFSYKGCYPLYELDYYTVMSTRADPGHCYSYCKTPFIGLFGLTKKCCYTHGYMIKISRTYDRCRELCDLPEKTLCGGEDGRKFVSVYENVPYHHNASHGNTNASCLAYSIANQKFLWLTCDKQVGVVCKYANGTLFYSFISYMWIDAIIECSKRRLLSVDSTTNLSSISNIPAIHVWTGTIRTLSIVISQDTTSTETIHQGYVKQENGSFNLHFKLGSEPLRALCKGDRPTTTSAKTITPVTTESSSETDQLTTSPSNSGFQESQQEEKTHSGLVAVYVLVPLVLVLVAAVIGFLIWRRRKRPPGKPSKPPEYVNKAAHAEPGPIGLNAVNQAPSNYEASLPTDRDEHQYAAIEPSEATADSAYENIDNENAYENQPNKSEVIYENK